MPASQGFGPPGPRPSAHQDPRASAHQDPAASAHQDPRASAHQDLDSVNLLDDFCLILDLLCQAHHEYACTFSLKRPLFYCSGWGQLILVKIIGGLPAIAYKPLSLPSVWLNCVSQPHSSKRRSQVLVTLSSSSFLSLLNHQFVRDASPALLG